MIIIYNELLNRIEERKKSYSYNGESLFYFRKSYYLTCFKVPLRQMLTSVYPD